MMLNFLDDAYSYVREPVGDQEVSGEHREGTRKCVEHQRSDVRRDDQVD